MGQALFLESEFLQYMRFSESLEYLDFGGVLIRQWFMANDFDFQMLRFFEVMRAAVLNAVLLSSYDEVKHQLMDLGLEDGHILRFSCKQPFHYFPFRWKMKQIWGAVVSGFLLVMAVAPFDLARTRLMDSHGKYRHMPHCLFQTVKHEGFLALYKGWLPQ